MQKIAIINLRFKVDISFEKKESLGISYISSMLRSKGHYVKIIDAQYFDLEVDQVFNMLTCDNYDVIAFSIFEETMVSFNSIYTMLKDKTNAHIVLGGHYATFTASEILKKYPRVNSISIGEGEMTILELVENLENSKWKEIDGICYLEKDEVVYTPHRTLIEDLDSIPYPDRDVYFLENKNDSRSVTISASRGCYAQCSFCSIKSFYKNLKGKKVRVRVPEKVVDEMEYVINRYGINTFFFADDNFLSTCKIHKDWLEKFMNEIVERKLEISFDIDCRVDDIDKNIFNKLKKVGLRGVFLGIESFSQRVLNTFNKRVTVQDNINAIMLLHGLRITVWMGFIMFDMYTTLDEIRKNIEVLKKINYFRYFNYDRPLSGDRLASPLKLYNGTSMLKEVMDDNPHILIREEFGYDYLFLNKKTEVFYKWLAKWKEVSKEMIKLDTLWLISLSNKYDDIETGNKLHLQSRRYMKLDLMIFEKILNAVDNNQINEIPNIINHGKKEFYLIKEEIDKLKNKLLMRENNYEYYI